MAIVRPFRAFCPNPYGNPLDSEVFENLIHPQGMPDERSKFVRYARSASTLHSLVADQTLVKTNQPSFCVVGEPGAQHLLFLLDLAENPKMVVEADRRASVERSWLTEATQTQFEPVGVLPFQPIALPDFPSGPITDPEQIATIKQAFENTEFGIVTQAETLASVAKAFRDRRRPHPVHPKGAVMCAVPLERTNARLRSVPITLKSSGLGPERIQGLLLEHFVLRPTSNNNLMANMNHPNNMQPGVFGLALPDGYSFTAQALDIESLASEINVPVGSPAISHRVVHQFVFEKLFGLTSLDLFTYTKSTQEALDSVMAADGSAFFLGDPENPSMEDTAIATGVFPPRSVDLAPPVPAGWALWSLGDLDA